MTTTRFHLPSQHILLRLVVPLIVAALAVAFSIRYSPAFQAIGRDGGVFLYGGDQILKGARPYVDFWDHKPPLIYLLNAAGLSLGAGRWGVWGFETVLFAAAVAVLFIAARHRLGTGPALIAAAVTILGCRNPIFFQRGNFTEGYASSFTMLLLACVLWQPDRARWWLLAGVAASAIFFLKQSCIGTAVAVGILLVWSSLAGKDLQRSKMLLAYCAGAVAMTVLILLWMAGLGVLAAFWDCNFVYNRIYLHAQAGSLDFLRRCWRTLTQFDKLGLVGLAGTSILSSAVAWVLTQLRAGDARLWLPSAVVVLSIPLEMFFMGLPFRFYGHYYITLFPIIGVAWALWAKTAGQVADFLAGGQGRPALAWTLRAALLLLPLCALSGPVSITQQRSVISDAIFPKGNFRDQEIVNYLKYRGGHDPLLVWGAETWVNFVSGRVAPTRYHYMYPLTSETYDQDARLKELLGDLRAHPNTLIIDTLGDSPNCLDLVRSKVPARGVDKGIAWHPIPDRLIQPIRIHVARHYRQDRVFSNGWIAYLPQAGGVEPALTHTDR